MSADIVAFASTATNLVKGDTNAQNDVFIHNRVTGVTERVSVATDGTQGNAASTVPDVSADGRYVAFISNASNLVAGDTNNGSDIFVRDRQTGTTERVNVASDESQANATLVGAPTISADGRYVAFDSSATSLDGDAIASNDVFVRDRVAGTTTRVSVSSSVPDQGRVGGSTAPAISADGRYVAFESTVQTLVVGDTNNDTDIFVYDRATGTLTRVSVSTNGTEGNDQSVARRSVDTGLKPRD